MSKNEFEVGQTIICTDPIGPLIEGQAYIVKSLVPRGVELWAIDGATYMEKRFRAASADEIPAPTSDTDSKGGGKMTLIPQRFLEKFFGLPRDPLRYRLKCRDCQTRFEMDRMPKYCPECGQQIIRVVPK